MTEHQEKGALAYMIDHRSPDQAHVFAEHGLEIRTRPADAITARLHNIPLGSLAGRMKFTPYGRSEFTSKYKTENLLALLQGFEAFFFATDASILEPQFLIGSTNPDMSDAMSGIFGFSTIDDTVGLLGRRCRIIAETGDVKQRLDQILSRRDRHGNSVIQQLEGRVALAKNKKIA